MCLAIPGKVVEMRGDDGTVDFGGVRRRVNLSLVDVKPGTYVIVHAGFAIQVLDKAEAEASLKLWGQVLGGSGPDA